MQSIIARPLLLLSLLSLSFLGCKKDEDDTNAARKAVLQNYANIVLANYEDSYDAAKILKDKIDLFVANPTAQGFADCKQAWLNARNPYGQSEAFRFYGGPIDAQDGPEGLINAWPMDENFIDYVEGIPTAGLINNTAQYPTITQQVLADLNESISEESIFTGYHAIEFLLWGQDLSTSGPGNRPYTDYVTGAGGTASNQARRGLYLQAVAGLLLENLASVRDAWQPGSNYRKDFLENTATDVALGRLFTSLGELSKGELAGERMFVALDTKDQENEHSCFSDNTLADIKMNFLGIKNVYLGTYTRTNGSVVSGPSLASLAETTDKTKGDLVKATLTETEQFIDAIPGPFDQTILNNPNAVLPAITSLRSLSDRFADVGFALRAKF
jgi:putative iron-regulated protein